MNQKVCIFLKRRLNLGVLDGGGLSHISHAFCNSFKRRFDLGVLDFRGLAAWADRFAFLLNAV